MYPTGHQLLLPPANEVWGKVICLQACVCPRGCLVGGVPGLGGLVLGGAVCLIQAGLPGLGGSGPGGAWWRPPRTATAAGGTHPTEMHSCLKII